MNNIITFKEIKEKYGKALKGKCSDNTINHYKGDYINHVFKESDIVFKKVLGFEVKELHWTSGANIQRAHKYVMAVISGIVANKVKNKDKYWEDYQSAFNRFLIFIEEEKWGIAQGEFIDAILNSELPDVNGKNIKEEDIKRITEIKEELGAMTAETKNGIRQKQGNAVVKIIIDDLVKVYANEVVYSKDALNKVFLSRLTTQDRKYSNMFLPISILNQLTTDKSSKGYYNELNEKELNKLKIIIDDCGKSCKFSDVEAIVMRISEERSYVRLKNSGELKIIFTENKKGTFEELETIIISDLSIDHDDSVVNQLKKSENDYPELKQLTDEIIKYYEKKQFIDASNCSNYRELKVLDSDELLIDYIEKKGEAQEIVEEVKNKVDSEKICKELKKMFDGVGGYTIMDKSINSSLSGK